jgi:hypothetical protein
MHAYQMNTITHMYVIYMYLMYIRYTYKVAEWLKGERSKGRRLLVVTNSDADFAEFVMHVREHILTLTLNPKF